MATDTRSPAEIEHEIDAEREQLRDTVDEALNRLTFEDAWNSGGALHARQPDRAGADRRQGRP